MATAATTTAPKGNTGGTEQPAGQSATGDTKPGEQKPAETTGQTGTSTGVAAPEKPASKDGQAPPESKAPEKYSLTLPDGGRIDEHDLAIIESVARENGWSNEEAQQRVAAHADAIEAQSARFTEETKADTVYGGAQLDATLKAASRALDTLRPKGTARGDAFRALLDKSGYGNHLEVVSFLADLGKQMAEDGSAGSSSGENAAPSDHASLIYGSDKK